MTKENMSQIDKIIKHFYMIYDKKIAPTTGHKYRNGLRMLVPHTLQLLGYEVLLEQAKSQGVKGFRELKIKHPTRGEITMNIDARFEDFDNIVISSIMKQVLEVSTEFVKPKIEQEICQLVQRKHLKYLDARPAILSYIYDKIHIWLNRVYYPNPYVRTQRSDKIDPMLPNVSKRAQIK